MSENSELLRVAAVVLNYNGYTDTVACLKSLYRLECSPETIIVIDNFSPDKSGSLIASSYPEVDVVYNDKNYGFGEGHNRVLRRLVADEFDWIWLVNNDVCVSTDALGEMLRVARKNPHAGVIGTCIRDLFDPEKILAFGGGVVNHWIGRSRHVQIAKADLTYITGASMMLNCRALRSVGFFDPAFFMYWEDVDLCNRMTQRGWGLHVAESAVVWHRHSASVGGDGPLKDRLINESAVKYFSRYGPLKGIPAIVIGGVFRILKRLVTGRWRSAVEVHRGILEGLRHVRRIS